MFQRGPNTRIWWGHWYRRIIMRNFVVNWSSNWSSGNRERCVCIVPSLLVFLQIPLRFCRCENWTRRSIRFDNIEKGGEISPRGRNNLFIITRSTTIERNQKYSSNCDPTVVAKFTSRICETIPDGARESCKKGEFRSDLNENTRAEMIPVGDPFVYKPSKCSAAVRFRWQGVPWTRKRAVVFRLGRVQRLLFRLNIPSWNTSTSATEDPAFRSARRVIRKRPSLAIPIPLLFPRQFYRFSTISLSREGGKNRLLVHLGILQRAPWILLPRSLHTRRPKSPSWNYFRSGCRCCVFTLLYSLFTISPFTCTTLTHSFLLSN